MNPPAAKPRVATLKARDDWMKAMCSAGMPHGMFLVGVRLALHLNIETGRLDPSYRTLASEVGLSERQVIRVIAALEEQDWIEVEHTVGGRGVGHFERRRGYTNRFFLLQQPEQPAPGKGDIQMSPLKSDSNGVKGDILEPVRVTFSNVKGDIFGPVRVTSRCHTNREEEQTPPLPPLRGGTDSYEQSALCAPLDERARGARPKKKNGSAGSERARQKNRDRLRPDDRRAIGKLWEAQSEGKITEAEAERREAVIRAEARRRRADDWPDDFRAQFQAAYPHKVGMKPALALLTRVRRKGKVTWGDLIDGVHRYVEDHARGPLRDHMWLNPKTWLAEERWNDEPAPAPV